jgi:large subunit ribosomal protein L10Ae
MSKVSREVVEEAVQAIMAFSEEKKRNFTETIELQIALKNYDPSKDKRFSGVIRLPIAPRTKNIAVIGNAKDFQTAKDAGLTAYAVEDLKKLNKDKKLVKKLAAGHDGFLCSSTLIRQIPRLLGPGLNKAGKFPTMLGANDNIKSKAEDIEASIKFQLKSKKTMCMGVPVANVAMSQEDIVVNIMLAVNFLVSLLPKNWQQVKRLYIKSTMGPSQKVFGF